MALEDNNDIIIGEYLTGRLSDADKVLLEARMKENPDLNSQVKNEEQIMEGINEFKRINYYFQELKVYHQTFPQ